MKTIYLKILKATLIVSFLTTVGCMMKEKSTESKTLGLYTYGHEVSVFKPCHSKTEFWADGNEHIMNRIKEASMSLAEIKSSPYQAILIEATISKPEKAKEGFPADYDGVVTIEKVAKVYPTTQVCSMAQ